jgi:hypothetical protein
MLDRKERAFGLDYSLHPSLFKVKANCTRGKRLVDNVGKGFGHLNSIFCLLSRDKVNSMANIGG